MPAHIRRAPVAAGGIKLGLRCAARLILGCEGHCERLAHRLRRGPAEDVLGPGHPGVDASVGIGGEDGVIARTLDNEAQPLLAFAQSGLGADPLDMRPCALHDGLDQGDFSPRPHAGFALMDRHHRDQPSLLDQRAAHDRLDPDAAEHRAAIIDGQLHIDMADDERAPRAHVRRGARAKQRQAVDPGAAGRAICPVVADGEAVIVGIDVGIGAAGRAQMPAEQFRRQRHDLARREGAHGRFAQLVEQLESLFAFPQGSLDAFAPAIVAEIGRLGWLAHAG